jgi:hypothetical protein
MGECGTVPSMTAPGQPVPGPFLANRWWMYGNFENSDRAARKMQKPSTNLKVRKYRPGSVAGFLPHCRTLSNIINRNWSGLGEGLGLDAERSGNGFCLRRGQVMWRVGGVNWKQDRVLAVWPASWPAVALAV